MGKTFYIFSSGRLERKENTLRFVKSSGEVHFIPINQVEEIYLFGEVDFNVKLLTFIARNEIVLHVFNHYGFYVGSFYPRETNVSGTVIVKQVEHYLDKWKRLGIAREFVSSAVFNMRRVLSKRNLQKGVESLKPIDEEIQKVSTINDLLLVEAKAWRIYYSFFETITNWKFEERSFRPPENPLNAMISFGNSLLYTAILKEIYYTQLHPALSFLHEPFERRFSLCLDIAEIFKPILVDRLVFRMINEGMITLNDFLREVNFAYLKERARKVFVNEFDKTLETTVYHRNLRRKVSYRNLIRLELYKLIKHLIGDKKYKALRMWW